MYRKCTENGYKPQEHGCCQTPRLERRAWDLSDLCTYLSEADKELGHSQSIQGPQLEVYKGNFQLPITSRLYMLYLNN